MNIKYLTPDTVSAALELKANHGSQAVWFAGGSKLNAAPTRSDAGVFVAIDKLGLDYIKLDGNTLTLGAMSRIQDLVDSELVPSNIKQAAGFIYSRHLRNQSTIGGEIAAHQCEAPLVPVLMALNALVRFADDKQVELEAYIQQPSDELIKEIVVPDITLAALSKRVARSADGLRVINASVSVDKQGKQIVAMEGVATRFDEIAKPIRLRDVEGLTFTGDELEQAIKNSIHAVEDICGSAEYKTYLSAIVISDLLIECREMAKGVA
ncbi:molybdopterin-dependent oxidoreductase FAD-binding subunit [Vibrio mediterranei]|uniref:Molybdopterin-dependent oxidoreductase FAD-binding subunit n=1 Tax=Vibrio mediterranei TaxID=689 RepID=A0AAN1FKR2_9VIBR|nr:molybdopterin-dependent oxidoreductase FAD-binding subunit [Vibrio mediterranei]ASI92404.1 molybdopterin-dependent oxidoreductase FAD-binding subunit [Vibrio mediterranei]